MYAPPYVIVPVLQEIDINDPKYMFVVDGKKRKLRVNNVSSKDEGLYSCKVQNKETRAKLYVARKYMIINTNMYMYMYIP